MLPGNRGAFGPAIYFAPSPLSAHFKSHNQGTGRVVANLTMRNPVELYEPWRELTFEILQEKGFDCVIASCFESQTEFAMYRGQDVQIVSVETNFNLIQYEAMVVREVVHQIAKENRRRYRARWS
jgi:hypothetical protein